MNIEKIVQNCHPELACPALLYGRVEGCKITGFDWFSLTANPEFIFPASSKVKQLR